MKTEKRSLKKNGSKSTDFRKIPSLCIYKSDVILRILFDKLHFSMLTFALLGLFLYYGVIFIINLGQGTLIPYEFFIRLENIPVLRLILKVLPFRQISVPVITDKTHTIFSLVAPFAGFLWFRYFSKKVNRSFFKLRLDNVFDFNKRNYAKFILDAQSGYDCRWAKVVCFVGALLFFITFIIMARSPRLTYWWGHHTHGLAGHYLAFILSVVAYYIAFFTYTLFATIRVILKLKKI